MDVLLTNKEKREEMEGSNETIYLIRSESHASYLGSPERGRDSNNEERHDTNSREKRGRGHPRRAGTSLGHVTRVLGVTFVGIEDDQGKAGG